MVTETQRQTAVTNGSQITPVFQIPDPYRHIIGLYYNPAIDYSVTLITQSGNIVVLNNFNTLTGSAYGFLPLVSVDLGVNARMTATLTNNNGANATLFLTLVYGTKAEAGLLNQGFLPSISRG